jgi:hypothetical protein
LGFGTICQFRESGHCWVMPPDFNPAAANLAELQARLNAAPFVPFRMVVSSGKSYDVPTPDHLTIMKISRTVIVEYDDRPGAYIHPLHITAIEPLAPAGQP